MTGLQIIKSSAWRPGYLLCNNGCAGVQAVVCDHAVQGVQYDEHCLPGDCEVEQLYPKAVFLLDTEDTEQGQEEEVLVDQMALADTFMVSWPCFSHAKAKVSTS